MEVRYNSLELGYKIRTFIYIISNYNYMNTFKEFIQNDFDNFSYNIFIKESYFEILLAVDYLRKNDKNYNEEIAKSLRIQPNTCSEHLLKLKKLDLLSEEKIEGKTKYITINLSALGTFYYNYLIFKAKKYTEDYNTLSIILEEGNEIDRINSANKYLQSKNAIKTCTENNLFLQTIDSYIQIFQYYYFLGNRDIMNLTKDRNFNLIKLFNLISKTLYLKFKELKPLESDKQSVQFFNLLEISNLYSTDIYEAVANEYVYRSLNKN